MALSRLLPMLLCGFFVISMPMLAQHRVWVFFTDHGMNAEAILDNREHAQLHTKAMSSGRSVDDELNLPPSAEYIEAIERLGARVHVRSRWLNAVSVSADVSTLRAIHSLPYVASMQNVRTYRSPVIEAAPSLTKPRTITSYGLDYGQSLDQLIMIDIPKVHDIWIDGTDITIGMLDNGYRWRWHEALSSLQVRGEYDFINRDSLTENEAGDPPGQDGHGTITFSALAGFKEGQLIGPAFNASYFLAKTEVNGSETQIEEDYWVEGMEWLESCGASVISASLGYLDWDDGTGYSWEDGDLDGQTAVTSRAASAGAKRGLVIVTAMGNEGSTVGTIIAPADADTVISVGAVTFLGQVAGFSSSGPTSDGRIKPDIVAPGVGVFSAERNGGYARSSGTSLATPLAAGAAALLRSARPELTPYQVREALRETADNIETPNNRRGWGMINAWDALLYHGMVISTNPKIFYSAQRSYIMAWVVSRDPIVGEVVLHYSVDDGGSASVPMRLLSQYQDYGVGAGLYSAELPFIPEGRTVAFYIAASDIHESRTSPYGAPDRRHTFISGETRALGAGHLLPTDIALMQNYPNPFAPSSSGVSHIQYEIPMPGGRVRLLLHDALGRVLRTLVDADKGAGTHTAVFDGSGLSSGVYYYSLTSGGRTLLRRMIILQ